MNLYSFHDEPEKRRGYHQALDLVPEVFWEKYKNNPAELKKREDAIAKSPKYAILYASVVLNGPWLKGEDAIAKSPKHAYWYARDILHSPWPKGEEALAEHPNLAYLYAVNVLNGPFPKGEAAIAKSPVYGGPYRVFLSSGYGIADQLKV